MKRIAIVGCGRIAQTHGLCIQDLGYELVAVTSRTRQSAESYAERYPELRADWLTDPDWMTLPARAKLREQFKKPTVFPDIASMKTCGPLDAVIVASNHSSHCPLVETVAQTLEVKTILCEKPMAMSLAECRRMVEICKARNIRLAVYQDSFLRRPYFIQARRLLDQKQIGQLEFIRGNGGSSLMDISVYVWAAILHLTRSSGVRRIEAFLESDGKRVSNECLHEDRATVHFHLENELHGVLWTNQPDPRGFYLRFDGTEGSLEISFLRSPSLRIWQSGMRCWEVLAPPPCSYDYNRLLLEGVVSDDPAFRDFNGESAIRATLPIFATWQSHHERRGIDLLNENVTFEIPRAAA